MQTIKHVPPRLDRIFATYASPIYFITFCAHGRNRILARDEVKEALEQFGRRGEERGIAIGRYVIMPDHVHLFVRLYPELSLSQCIRLLKRSLSSALAKAAVPGPHWQHGFFDRLLRQSESYSQKWEYVRLNPVRAGLAEKSEDWPYQGEIVKIRM